MMHVIVYDIADDRRLRRVASLCEDYGIRVEKSVFECELDPDEYARFWYSLSSLVDEEVDRVIDYPLNQQDKSRIREIGHPPDREHETLVF